MNRSPAFLESEFTPAAPEKALFHIIPCPFEKSVSYGKGAAKGPAAILAASLELEAMETGMTPGQAGFYTAPPVDCDGPTAQVLSRIEKEVGNAVRMGAIPLVLGGEHTVTLGALRAMAASLGKKFGIVQFDAHADLREEYKGDRFSHASFMRRAAEELNLPIVQFAGRDFSQEEMEFRHQHNITFYDAYLLGRIGLPEQPLPEDFPRDIYITFDLDAFDSSLMPATGTPSPGGINWREAQFILEACARDHSIVGLDIVELAPIEGLHHADFTAAKLAHLLMGLAWRARIEGKLPTAQDKK